jgi:hypothetical protein
VYKTFYCHNLRLYQNKLNLPLLAWLNGCAKDYVMDKLKLTGGALGRVFNSRSGCCILAKHLLNNAAIRPNLGLKTRPKQLLGSLPLVTALPDSVLTIYFSAV